MRQSLKTKIIFFVPSFAGGGAERVMSTLINEIDKSKFEITVITLGYKEGDYPIYPDKQISLNRKRVLTTGCLIYKIIKREKPQIFFCTLTYVNTYIGLIDYLFKFKTILIARESTIPSVNHKQRKLGLIYNVLLKIAYKRFRLIICQSASMANDLAIKFRINYSLLKIINNPIAFKDASLSLPSNDKYKFVTIAMLRPEKGIKRLLECLAMTNLMYEYYIVGDGPEMNTLQKLARDLNLGSKVFFVGFSPNTSYYLKDAHVYLHGSFYEGFPNVLLEAGIYGVPVLALEGEGGTSEILINNINGKTVQSYSEFVDFLESRNWTQYNREAISEYVSQKYGSRKIIKEYEKVFLESKTKF